MSIIIPPVLTVLYMGYQLIKHHIEMKPRKLGDN